MGQMPFLCHSTNSVKALKKHEIMQDSSKNKNDIKQKKPVVKLTSGLATSGADESIREEGSATRVPSMGAAQH